MSDLVEKLRKAADWGEGEFDVLSPQDAAAAADRIEQLEREVAEAVAAERERCAKVAEEYAVPLRANVESSSDAHTFALNTVGVVIVEAIAAAIRNGERG